MASPKFSIINLYFILMGVLILVLDFIIYAIDRDSITAILAIILLFFSLLLLSYSFSKIAEKVLYWTLHLCSILLGLLLSASSAFLFNGKNIITIIAIIIFSTLLIFYSIKALRKKEKNISVYEQFLCIASLILILASIGAIVNYSGCCHM
jgi:FtsH-binding integral membrane protein